MTENEAIKEIETSLELAEMCEPNREREKEIKGYKMAIQALEEIQQYRAYKEIFESYFSEEALGLLSDKEEFGRWLERGKWIAKRCDEIARELEQYKAIGTVEEFAHAKRFQHIAEMAVDYAEKEKQEIRNKAIDEFAEVIRGIHYNYPIGTDADTNEPLYAHEDGTWHNLLNDVAEQMKGGAV